MIQRASFFTLIITMIGMMTAAHAANQGALGVGDSIPDNFTAKDAYGRDVTFESIKGNNGLVLLFTRSADWCQYCKAQLVSWNMAFKSFEGIGKKVAAISYDTPEILSEFAKKNEIKYELLSDTNSDMIDAFGIRNMKFEQGSRFYGIPNPAIYVFDANGKITHVFREEDYKERPTIGEVLEAIQP